MTRKNALRVCLFAIAIISQQSSVYAHGVSTGILNMLADDVRSPPFQRMRPFLGNYLKYSLVNDNKRKNKGHHKALKDDSGLLVCPEHAEEPISLVDLIPMRNIPSFTKDLIERDERFDIYEISFEIGEKDKISVSYEWYRPNAHWLGNKLPMVFLFPGIGGTTFLDDMMAQDLAGSGINVVVMHFFEEDHSCHIEGTEQLALRTLRATMATIDTALSQGGIDEDKLAILGTSYGGIRGSYYMGIDPRIKAAALIVAGGPLPDVMAYSKQSTMSNIRKTQMHNAGITDEDLYLEALNDSVSFTLKELLEHRNPEEFMLFIAEKDDWVPTRFQHGLGDIISKGEDDKLIKYSFNSGHRMTPFKVAMFYMGEIYSFFKDRWEPAEAEAAPAS